MLKAALLDQRFILCGLGNWLVDDICYHAGVDPSKRCDQLNAVQCFNILHSATHICSRACDADGDSNKFLREWLFHLRWGVKRAKTTSPLKTIEGNNVKVGTIAGRTTVWVPCRQTKGGSKSRTVTKSSLKPKQRRKRNVNPSGTLRKGTKKRMVRSASGEVSSRGLRRSKRLRTTAAH